MTLRQGTISYWPSLPRILFITRAYANLPDAHTVWPKASKFGNKSSTRWDEPVSNVIISHAPIPKGRGPSIPKFVGLIQTPIQNFQYSDQIRHGNMLGGGAFFHGFRRPVPKIFGPPSTPTRFWLRVIKFGMATRVRRGEFQQGSCRIPIQRVWAQHAQIVESYIRPHGRTHNSQIMHGDQIRLEENARSLGPIFLT